MFAFFKTINSTDVNTSKEELFLYGKMDFKNPYCFSNEFNLF